jgi:hypothetical protein
MDVLVSESWEERMKKGTPDCKGNRQYRIQPTKGGGSNSMDSCQLVSMQKHTSVLRGDSPAMSLPRLHVEGVPIRPRANGLPMFLRVANAKDTLG